jgi:Mg2+ and Co2+ transporter CorA
MLEFLQATTAALGTFSFIVLFLTVIVGVWGLNVAIMIAFWRPSPALISATANA